MATGTTPRSQKADARPIGFLLHDLAAGTDPVAVTLIVRPEDLTKTDPSRLATQQTLGGAWVDSFGAGLTSIAISGHTGWRGSAVKGDGMAVFQDLHDTIFTRWHLLRADAVSNGQDPNLVKLIFADALDDYSAVVTPNNFSLRRSKSRPLLMQYQIGMTVVDEDIGIVGAFQALSDQQKADAALESLQASIGTLSAESANLGPLDSALAGLGAASKQFTALSADVFKTVNGAVNAVQGEINSVVEPLVGVAANLALAGRNIFYTVSDLASLPSRLKASVMRIASAYNNVFCIFKNALKPANFYPNYSSLFGASTCSSTNGGSPISQFMNSNGLEAAFKPDSATSVSQFRINGIANNSMVGMGKTDVVNAPSSLTGLRDSMTNITSGFALH